MADASVSDDRKRLAELERENAKLRRINEALMSRVERSTDLQGNAFALFETAIALEEKVRQRTADLEVALGELAASHAASRQAQAAAEAAQRRLSDAIESINEGFALFDAEDRLVLCNQTYLSFFSRVAEYIVPGMRFAEIVRLIREDGTTIGALASPDRWMLDRLARHRVADSTHMQALADGRWIQINELRTSEGGIVGVYTDITQIKSEEAALSAMNAELQEAKTAAEQANISKTRFLAAASHDLLQPLNAARLFVSALGERALDRDSRNLVRKTGSALDSVEDLLEALLEISKLDAGAVKPEVGPVRLRDLFNALRAEFTPIAEERGLRLEIPSVSAVVKSDPRLLRRIIQNFLSNAIRYTDEGRVSLTVEPADGGVRVRVRDTGRGIAPENHSAIFEEFCRLDATRSAGIGLGLAIVQRAGRMLGHPITVESELGHGSCFSLMLPLADEDVQAPVASPARSRRGVAARRILVIDNEETILDGMEALLGGWGCSVSLAASGDEAVARLGRDGAPPELVIADYHLDEELGDAAVGRVRAAAGTNIPAIIITADRTPELRDRLLAAGFHLLQKPVKPAQLRALLGQLAHES